MTSFLPGKLIWSIFLVYRTATVALVSCRGKEFQYSAWWFFYQRFEMVAEVMFSPSKERYGNGSVRKRDPKFDEKRASSRLDQFGPQSGTGPFSLGRCISQQNEQIPTNLAHQFTMRSGVTSRTTFGFNSVNNCNTL